jgi:hypothetical protein
MAQTDGSTHAAVIRTKQGNLIQNPMVGVANTARRGTGQKTFLGGDGGGSHFIRHVLQALIGRFRRERLIDTFPFYIIEHLLAALTGLSGNVTRRWKKTWKRF